MVYGANQPETLHIYEHHSGLEQSEPKTAFGPRHVSLLFRSRARGLSWHAELPLSPNELGQGLVKTVRLLEQWSAETGSVAPSYYNFAVTDGKSIAAIRYVSDPTMEPATLYYSARGKYQCVAGECQFVDCHDCERSVVIASERLNENDSDWIRVAPNHVLTVNQELEAHVELMEVERHGSRVETSSLYRRGRQSK